MAGSLSSRAWVCVCKAACQESTSPVGDMAAGCLFPLKSPGRDSGGVLNIRCLPPPGGEVNGRSPNRGPRCSHRARGTMRHALHPNEGLSH